MDKKLTEEFVKKLWPVTDMNLVKCHFKNSEHNEREDIFNFDEYNNDGKYNELKDKFYIRINGFNDKLLSSRIIYPKDDLTFNFLEPIGNFFYSKSSKLVYNDGAYWKKIKLNLNKDCPYHCKINYNNKKITVIINDLHIDCSDFTKMFYTYYNKYNVKFYCKIIAYNNSRYQEYFIYQRNGVLHKDNIVIQKKW